MIAAIKELQNAGVEPDVWKIEGLDRRDDCAAVVTAAQRDGPDKVGRTFSGAAPMKPASSPGCARRRRWRGSSFSPLAAPHSGTRWSRCATTRRRARRRSTQSPTATSSGCAPSRTRAGADREGEDDGRSLGPAPSTSQIITFSAKLPNAVVTMKASPTARERHASRCGYSRLIPPHYNMKMASRPIGASAKPTPLIGAQTPVLPSQACPRVASAALERSYQWTMQ
jgi:hypothetical protein